MRLKEFRSRAKMPARIGGPWWVEGRFGKSEEVLLPFTHSRVSGATLYNREVSYPESTRSDGGVGSRYGVAEVRRRRRRHVNPPRGSESVASRRRRSRI